MRILLFYQYYHNPDCSATGRHYQFVKALGRRHEVHVITSDVWEDKRNSSLFEWTPPGVTLHSFPVEYENAMSVRDRLSAYSRFAIGAIQRGMRVPRPDVIIGTSTPLTAAWAASIVARWRRVPWVFEVRDLWPDFPIQMGAFSNEWIKNRLYALEKQLYARAAHIVTLSPDMKAHVLRYATNPEAVTTLLNGTDLDLNDRVTPEDVKALRTEHGLGEKKIILYAGTFGRANAIPLLIDTARALRHRKDLHFVFLGEGFHLPQLKEAEEHCSNVSVYPPEPRHKIFQWFHLASLSLVSFIDLPVLAANSPAKFFDSLAAGTPAIVTNPGWTRSFVEQHKCGWYTPASEPASVVQGIERALDDPKMYNSACENGRNVAYQLFDRALMAEELESILMKLGGTGYEL